MSNKSFRTINLILSLALLTGCGTTATPTSVPPTDAPILSTNTSLPPTEESAPMATPTLEPALPNNTWRQTYDRGRNDVANTVLMAEDGGFFILGTTNLEFEPEMDGDLYLLRTDADGEVLWEKTYGEDGYHSGNSIIPTDDGNFLITGQAASSGEGGMDIFLLKVDSDGEELWSKTFGGPLDEMVSAMQTPDGGFILGGNIVDPNDVVTDPGSAGYGGFEGRSNILLMKVDGEGNQLWTQVFDSDNNVIVSSSLQTPDEGYLIIANILNYPVNDNDIYLLKVDGDGNEIWSRTLEEDNMSGYELMLASDGNYVIGGIHALPGEMGQSLPDFLFLKIDSEGNQIWMQTYGDPDMIDHANIFTPTSDGGFLGVGDTVIDYYSYNADLKLIKIDAQGNLVWESIIQTNSHCMFANILQAPDGGFVIGGSIVQGGYFDIFLFKTDAEGRILD